MSDSPHNTARFLDSIVAEATVQVANDIASQFEGYNVAGWDNFVDEDGNAKQSYINSKGDLVDSTEVLDDTKRFEVCED